LGLKKVVLQIRDALYVEKKVNCVAYLVIMRVNENDIQRLHYVKLFEKFIIVATRIAKTSIFYYAIKSFQKVKCCIISKNIISTIFTSQGTFVCYNNLYCHESLADELFPTVRLSNIP
jgi:hypothetical protein